MPEIEHEIGSVLQARVSKCTSEIILGQISLNKASADLFP